MKSESMLFPIGRLALLSQLGGITVIMGAGLFGRRLRDVYFIKTCILIPSHNISKTIPFLVDTGNAQIATLLPQILDYGIGEPEESRTAGGVIETVLLLCDCVFRFTSDSKRYKKTLNPVYVFKDNIMSVSL